MKHGLKTMGALLVAAFLVGCSSGPDNADIENALNAMNNESFTKVSDFEKVNGYEEGDNKYVVDVNYEITFTESLDDLVANASGMQKMAYGMVKMAVGDFKKGDTVTDSTSITFVESENGWRPM